MLPERLRDHLVNGGRLERNGNRYRLIIPPVAPDSYSDAQLDDYDHALPRVFSNQPPQRLHVRARFSHREPKGTAGFGFWNHPFSREGAVVEPPCNVWFFYSSAESDLRVTRDAPGHGFKAAMLNSGSLPRPIMVVAGQAFNILLKLPVIANVMMSSARTAIRAKEVLLSVDMTLWHDYALEWLNDVAIFRVDGQEVLRAAHPPRQAMGFAAWVDNYRASAGNNGYRFAYVGAAEEQWLELEIMGSDE
ncbi:MAG: hypothetical protein M1434_03605 [Chloroflexi bacterium]|nr:hypothetical protein [Chloroflexota bacterium]MCL5273817.1 hypothetical protein [Chloroflexota bacterium]